ncbi:family 16 glycosylhydrolase [Bacteroidota bacterium]
MTAFHCRRILFTAITILVYVIGYSQCNQLVWADEFDYEGLPDNNRWTFEIGGHGWGNNEWEYYTDRIENAEVKDGLLTITAIKEDYSGSEYTSARLVTLEKFSFKYGKIEARIKLPYGQGIWPAFWMLGNTFETDGWPACGEIDIMEMIGGTNNDNTIHGTVHWDNNGQHAMYGNSETLSSGIFADDFHVFSVEWDSDKIVWKLDGTQYHVIDITPADLSEFRDEFFIILNLAVGGNWPGYPDESTVFPQTFEIDYVRVYSTDDYYKIIGKEVVNELDTNLQYSLPYDEDATYSWTVPEGITILGSSDSSAINVNWGSDSATINCEVTNTCGTNQIELFVNLEGYPNLINESFKKSEVLIYPNPFNDIIQIKTSNIIHHYELKDMTGRTIENAKIDDSLLNLEHVPPGLYLVMLEDIIGNKFYNKIIKE